MQFKPNMGTNIVTPRQIHDFETKLGEPLPRDYTMFLLRSNGGRPSSGEFSFVGVDGIANESAVASFFSLNCDDSNLDLSSNFEYYNGSGRIRDKSLPIASDIAGNLICLSFDRTDFGRIYFWDHEFEVEKVGQGNFAPLADGISEFLSSLYG